MFLAEFLPLTPYWGSRLRSPMEVDCTEPRFQVVWWKGSGLLVIEAQPDGWSDWGHENMGREFQCLGDDPTIEPIGSGYGPHHYRLRLDPWMLREKGPVTPKDSARLQVAWIKGRFGEPGGSKAIVNSHTFA